MVNWTRSRWSYAVTRLTVALVLLLVLAMCVAGGARSDAGAERAPAQQAAPTEEELLIQACRYLKLSRAQLRSLIPVARWTERVREPWEREDAAAQRELERLGDSAPEAAAQIQVARKERRDRATAEVSGFAVTQLVRVLTREQIGLAWRLHQGRPPRSAETGAALLLEWSAGFTASPRPAVSRNYRLRRGLDPGKSDMSVMLGKPLKVEELREQSEAALMTDLEVSFQTPRGAAGAQFKQPFMQLVVETSDLRELLPALEPLAMRLFMSPRCLPVFVRADREGLTAGLTSRSHLGALGPLRLLRDYRMELGFRDVAGRGPELEPLGGGIRHGVYEFDSGQGLRLESAGVTDHYALQLTFRYFGGDGYQKILDFKEGAEDGGLYLHKGHLTFYTLADGGVPVVAQEHRLRLERNRKTRVVRAYLDGRPIFAFLDLDDAAVFSQGKSLLFVDDRSTKTEQGPGTMRSVSIWGSPIGT